MGNLAEQEPLRGLFLIPLTGTGLLKTCRSHTLLDNTSETGVPLQKIGDQVEVFPYKTKQNINTAITDTSG